MKDLVDKERMERVVKRSFDALDRMANSRFDGDFWKKAALEALSVDVSLNAEPRNWAEAVTWARGAAQVADALHAAYFERLDAEEARLRGKIGGGDV